MAKATRAGRLVRLHRGVYAVGTRDPSWHGRCLGALLACAPAVASHWTAAWLWGFLATRPGTFHLTVATTRHRHPPFVVHYARLEEPDVGSIEAIPVTSRERTILDLAAAKPEQVEGFLESCEKQRVFDLRKFDALLARTRGHPGWSRLRGEVAAYRPEPAFTRSKLERRFLHMLREAGIRPPVANAIVGPYELDCWWEAERFAVEVDTFGTHGSRRSFERDRIRQRELARRGIAVERVTDRQLDREPREVLAAIAGRLAERRPRP